MKNRNFFKFNLIFLIICVIPLFCSIIFVAFYSVNVVYMDQWRTVEIIDSISKGTFQFTDLLIPHNIHIIFFPQILILLVVYLTKYNNIVEMYIIILFLLSSLVILFLYFKKKYSLKKNLFWFIPISFLAFSFKQYENMLNGWQITFLMPLVFSIAAFYFMFLLSQRKEIKLNILYFIIAAICGTIAMYSSFMGVFVWLIGLFEILFSPLIKKRKIIFTIIWLFIALSEGLIYLYFWQDNIVQISSNTVFSLTKFIKFIFMLIGNSLLWGNDIVFITGVIITIILVITIVLLKKSNRLNKNIFPLSIIAFSILSVLSIAYGRIGGSGATAPRYTSITILIIIALYMMIIDLNLYSSSGFVKFITGLLIGLIIISIPVAYFKGLESGEIYKKQKIEGAFILSTYSTQPEEYLGKIHPPSNVGPSRAKSVQMYAPILEKIKYNVFRDVNELSEFSNLTVSDSEYLFNIDEILLNNNKKTKQQKQIFYKDIENDFIVIKGWAVDSISKDIAKDVYIDIDGQLFLAFYGIDRKEISESLRNQSYRYSGFERAIRLSDIGHGFHNLSLKIASKDGRTYYQTEKYELELKVERYESRVQVYRDYDEIFNAFKFAREEKSKFEINVDYYQENDMINGETIIEGWVVDWIDTSYTGKIYLYFFDGPRIEDENYLGEIYHKIERQDVADFFNVEEYKYSGFKFLLDTRRLENGTHYIYVYAVNEKGIFSYEVLKYIIKN